MAILDKYFKRRFQTLTGVKIAIFFKRIYDWFRLTRDGEKILSQGYSISLGLDGDYYHIVNIIITANMLKDINELSKVDAVRELEVALECKDLIPESGFNGTYK